jgi:hypothetical protein
MNTDEAEMKVEKVSRDGNMKMSFSQKMKLPCFVDPNCSNNG